jgi:serine/threonine-protein kinase RsbT
VTTHRTLGAAVHVLVVGESDVAWTRQVVRELGAQQRLPEARVAALATAVTEIARNIVVHAGSGELTFHSIADGQRRGVFVVARDDGPGIPDIARAMQDGYSTKGGGLGAGLAGAKRLVDEFDISSAPGQGVTVTMTQWHDGGERDLL